MVKLKKIKALSLFAGAGGLDIALCDSAKVDKLVSTDSHDIFSSTVKHNIPIHYRPLRHHSITSDVRELSTSQITKILGNRVDLVMGGPPCDDFTKTGLRKGMCGVKGPLIFEFVKLIGKLAPKAFLFENVPNLTTDWKNVFDELITELQKSGYFLKWKILAACDYGAPTIRKRLFLVGFREEKMIQALQFPSPTHGENSKQANLFEQKETIEPFVTVANVLKDLPDVKTKEAKTFNNHTGRNHKAQTINHMKKVPQGKAIRESYRYRAPWEGLCRSLIAGLDSSTKSYLHPIYHREMSVREYARLHGFPDSWVFSGSHHNGIKQVANSVPIPLGRAVIESIINVLTTC